MLKLKVIALSVDNLTDARYFAAYLVDWIGFDINPASVHYIDPEKLNEILGWVEGPKYLLQGVAWNEDAQEIIKESKSKIEGVLLKQASMAFSDMQIFTDQVDIEDSIYLFETLAAYEKAEVLPATAFIKYNGDISLVHQLLAIADPPGLMLTGSAEEEVGLKAFDEMDEIFELLYD